MGEKYTCSDLVGKKKRERNNFLDIGLDGSIKLKCTLKKYE
jgi:hypothetical protein